MDNNRDATAASELKPGTIVSLYTRRANGISPMVEIVRDAGDWLHVRSIFGGRKVRRIRRSRIKRKLLLGT